MNEPATVPYFTIEETALRLRVGKRTVERLVSTGDLRSIVIGRRRFIRDEDIARYLRLAERRGRVA